MRRVRIALAAALIVLGGLSACTGPEEATPAGVSLAAATGGIPAGWRWETYGGVRVAVPGSYVYANSSQRIGQWCAGRQERPPAVGRPGGATEVACPAGGEDTVASTGPIVAFGRTGLPDGTDRTGDRVTVRVAGIAVIVQTTPDVRERIAATVGPEPVTATTCPADHPILADPAWQPPPGDPPRGAPTVVLCGYGIGAGKQPGVSLWSRVLTGAAATRVTAAIDKAPLAARPPISQDCRRDLGHEQIVVRVLDDQGRLSEHVVRYASCGDDGVAGGDRLRQLTDEVRAAVVVEPAGNLTARAA